MSRQTKQDFLYAHLFQKDTGTYCTDGSLPDLEMGTETAKRFASNDDCAVTVCCITYNHEQYIRQALDSFLMQKTNFKFKVFVGEDCGPDGTADIIREYAEKYPDIIIPFLREENMGAQRNLIDLCQHADSPYIAFCEGDDYWVDEYKLQKQYDYMQSHPLVRMCYTNTEILAPVDWHLTHYYKHDKHSGKMILPGCTPGFRHKRYYYVRDFIRVFPNHTSSAFYRWNYDLDIPDWYYEGLIGDTPITLLQMGHGTAAYLPDVTSVYRRSDVGVFMNKNHLEHFANTRLDYVRLLKGLRSYFAANLGTYLDSAFRNRTSREICNYLNTAKQYADTDMVHTLFDTYPKESFEALHSMIGSFNIYYALQGKLGNRYAYLLGETKGGFLSVFPTMWFYSAWRRIAGFARKGYRQFKKYFLGHILYWKNSLVKKQPNLWVFSGFRGRNYMDNCMYLYEYIREHHPEIEAVWLTNDRYTYTHILAKEFPVYYMQSKQGKNILAHAAVAVTDHFIMSDFSPVYGFNNRTKVVQLWHGVGFKSMGDKHQVRNTTERGVQYSHDILPQPGDNMLVRLGKKLKYFFVAPFRERFEQYFLLICPGQERLDMLADVWNIPHKNCFMAGHPRDLPVYTAVRQTSPIKIMYAPTYRFNHLHEYDMVKEFLEYAPTIQKMMEEIDGEFYLRMHPHTWRNYRVDIQQVLHKLDRVLLDDNKDAYQTIGTFSILISDYSSISLDFAVLDRPVIFHAADYDWFIENEAGFNVDFPQVIPGPMTRTWTETLQKVREYAADPTKDADLRAEKLKYFFNRMVNGPDNSERIVAEIKRRLGLPAEGELS